MKDIPKKRINFFVPPYLHLLIKQEAVQKEMTITRFIINAVLEKIMESNQEGDSGEHISKLKRKIKEDRYLY